MKYKLKDITDKIISVKNKELKFFFIVYICTFFKFLSVEYVTSSGFLYSYPAIYTLLSSFGILMAFYSITSLFHNKIRCSLILIVAFLFSVLAYTDIMHMRFYGDLFTFRNLGLTTQVSEIKESVIALFRITDLLYFADIFAILLLYVLYKSKTKENIFSKLTVKRIFLSLLIFLFGFSLYALRVYTYNQKVPGVLKSMWDKPAVCNNIGALSYHMVDFQNVLRDLFTKGHISKVEIEEISNWYIERDTNRQPNKFTGIAKGKNLIIIQVESLQEFVIDLKINGKEVTPNLNKFVKKSLYFPRTYNQTSVGNSSDAEFIVNTGLYPAESGVAYTRFATNEYHSLPFLLTEKGYNVLALHGDREGFWNRHKMYPALGFNKFISKKDFIVDENIGMGLSDRSFFSQSIEKMKKEKEPFYAFLITLTSHYPFDFPELLQQSDLDVTGLDDCLLTNYLKGMRYFDNHFGDFVKKLEEEGFTENSLIVIYGDHTAIPKGETSRLEKILNKELREDVQWKDFQRIPLIIKLPDSISKSNVLNTTTGQIDVSATVANLLGYSYKAGMGNDLFSKEKNVPLIFRNGTYILDCSYIEPSQMKSTSINSNKELKYTNFKKISYKVKKELSYSDKILEYNLMKKLKYSK